MTIKRIANSAVEQIRDIAQPAIQEITSLINKVKVAISNFFSLNKSASTTPVFVPKNPRDITVTSSQVDLEKKVVDQKAERILGITAYINELKSKQPDDLLTETDKIDTLIEELDERIKNEDSGELVINLKTRLINIRKECVKESPFVIQMSEIPQDVEKVAQQTFNPSTVEQESKEVDSAQNVTPVTSPAKKVIYSHQDNPEDQKAIAEAINIYLPLAEKSFEENELIRKEEDELEDFQQMINDFKRDFILNKEIGPQKPAENIDNLKSSTKDLIADKKEEAPTALSNTQNPIASVILNTARPDHVVAEHSKAATISTKQPTKKRGPTEEEIKQKINNINERLIGFHKKLRKSNDETKKNKIKTDIGSLERQKYMYFNNNKEMFRELDQQYKTKLENIR
ncbi:MAG: hypothetical protein Q8L98_05565 [Chlamydiales bacterium]|nr:hypothetical protein [Chlamydiales bacterium]